MDIVKRGFKKKTIEKTIRDKMEAWIKTLPEELRDKVRSDYIVTGGAIPSMLLGDLPNDYDVYFKSLSVAKQVAELYVKSLGKSDLVSDIGVVGTPAFEPLPEGQCGRVRIVIRSAGIAEGGQAFDDYRYFEMAGPADIEKYFDKHFKQKEGSYKAVLLTDNAISLSDNVQLIIRFVGKPEVIHKNYDFVHCTNWYTHEGGLILNQPALESILSRELKYVGSLYPVCSMFRIKKFIRRGWTITAGEMLKIAWDINKLNLQDRLVLQEQLVGVDQAYFHQLIELLNAKQDIDRTYLWECINRVFDTDEFEDMFFKNGDDK